MGYQIIAVSPDRPEKVAEISAKTDFAYRLLSDSNLRLARALGVAYRVEDSTHARLKEFGIDIEESSGRTHHLLPVPSVFIVNKQGVIQFQYVNPDHKTRIEPDVLLAAAKAAFE